MVRDLTYRCQKAGVRYVGTHPMAGREKNGYYASIPDLFQNANLIVTPVDGTDEAALDTVKELAKQMGFGKIVTATPMWHDNMIAYTSQLAHVVSSSYVKDFCMDDALSFSGGSFQDMTRVATMDESMWALLFLDNRDNLLYHLDLLIENLTDYRDALKQRDEERLQYLKAEDTEGQYGRLEAVCSGIREEDWANNWKQYFKPFPVGKKLYIKPSWEEPTAAAEGRTILEIDPASSFGTGQHHTTRLCLELMENEIVPDSTRLLDLGCGSGILFIGGMLLGAKEAYAVDIEENATRIARENAAENHLDPERYTISCGNIISDETLRQEIGSGYDVITANIVADVIKGMAPLFPGFLKDNGILILLSLIHI